MRYHLNRAALRLTLIAFIILISAPLQSHAADTPPLVVQSIGLLDADGTALYSVMLASGDLMLGKLTITASVPANTDLVEVVTAPPGATSTADPKIVTWEIDKIDDDMILGPFTYRVRPVKGATNIPLSAAASVSWTQPTAGKADATLSAGILNTPAELGKITVDINGTLDHNGENNPVEVGDSGIMLFVPAGALSEPTALTLRQLKIDDKNVPVDPSTWWCSLVTIMANPAANFAKPIWIAVPTRQVLTPGLDVRASVREEGGKWRSLESIKSPSTGYARFANQYVSFIAPNGKLAVLETEMPIQGSIQLAFGVNSGAKQASTVAGTALPQIKDGTSNTAIQYVQQDNIIAILIGAR